LLEEAFAPASFALGTKEGYLANDKGSPAHLFRGGGIRRSPVASSVVVAELIFGWPVTDTLVQVVLAGVAGTGILTTIAVHEGWYLEHLSGWGLAGDRVEPSLRARPPSPQGADGGDGRPG
jgi:hypothetical protein